MKTTRYLFVCLAAVSLAAQGRYAEMNGGPVSWISSIPVTVGTNMFMQGSTERMAFRFLASSTSAITGCDVNLKVNGDTTGITQTMDIETDSAGVPSGTLVGTATSAYATPTVSGWLGMQTLGTNTGALTLNTPYHLVIKDGGGTAPSASNYFQLQGVGNAQITGQQMHSYNGTNWTTRTAVTFDGEFVCHRADGTYFGLGATSAAGASVLVPKLYSTNRYGLRVKYGAPVTLRGVRIRIGSTTTPASLDFTVYAGSTVLSTITVPLATFIAAVSWQQFSFGAVPLPANTPIYIVAHQTADGGSAGSYYNPQASFPNATYLTTVQTADQALVYGTSSDPTALTVATTEIPSMIPIIDNPVADILGVPYGAYAQ